LTFDQVETLLGKGVGKHTFSKCNMNIYASYRETLLYREVSNLIPQQNHYCKYSCNQLLYEQGCLWR